MTTWLGRLEYYPLSAMAMFAEKHPGSITYYKFLKEQASGKITAAHFEQAIGAMADARYKRVFKKTFNKNGEDKKVATEFLKICGKILNTKYYNNDPITHFIIQQWYWDFGENKYDPNHGKMTNQLIYELKPRL